MKRISCILIILAIFSLCISVAQAYGPNGPGVLFQHIGGNDPVSEDWIPNLAPQGNISAGPITDFGVEAWFVDDNSTGFGSTINYRQIPTADQISEANSLGWRLRAQLRVVDIPDALDESIMVCYEDGSKSYVIIWGSEVDGDPIVQLVTGYDFSAKVFLGPTFTLEGSNGGYHEYELVYDPATNSASLSVDGTAQIHDYEGFAGNPGVVRVEWGSAQSDTIGQANYALVEFQIGANIAPVANAGTDQTVHAGVLVSLDGSGSYDPDANYPLSYEWVINDRPEGSTATLSDATTVSPLFIADMVGDYKIQLMVTDSFGISSQSDQIIVSTYNSAPVADAGPDQAVIEIGTTVRLDGSQSWDNNGDPITYSWTITTMPVGSLASVSEPTSATPVFIADVNGDYAIQLVVNDPWTSSDPDIVIVSFDNVKPVADAGDNQSVVQGDTVYLDGSESYDANLDMLTYIWSIVSKPTDSQAILNDPGSMHTHFAADLPGEYVVSLVVNDGFVDSYASNISIVAITAEDATTQELMETQDQINALDDGTLKNNNLKNSLTNKINAALTMIEEGRYQEALDKLEYDILEKTNGCADNGAPDNNDWIKDCDAQAEVYPLVMEAIEYLQNLQ